MTLVPNLLATGILTTAAALALGVWSVGHAGRRHGGLVLIALSVLLLLVGGGFGASLVGVIVGLAACRPDAATRRTPGRVKHLLWAAVALVARHRRSGIPRADARHRAAVRSCSR